MNNIGRRCAGRSAFVSQDQRRYIRAAEHTYPAPATNYRSEKPARVSRAINRRGRRSRAIDLRQNDARGPIQREKSGRAWAGVGQVNQKIARHTQNSTAQWNLNSAKAVELNSPRSPSLSAPLRLRLPSSFLSSPSPSSRVLFLLLRN